MYVGRLINDAGICLVDTPGIRFQSDSETTKLALDALNQHDGILVVLRSRTLSRSGKRCYLIPPQAKHVVILLTFADQIKGPCEVTEYLANVRSLVLVAMPGKLAAMFARNSAVLLQDKPHPPLSLYPVKRYR